MSEGEDRYLYTAQWARLGAALAALLAGLPLAEPLLPLPAGLGLPLQGQGQES